MITFITTSKSCYISVLVFSSTNHSKRVLLLNVTFIRN